MIAEFVRHCTLSSHLRMFCSTQSFCKLLETQYGFQTQQGVCYFYSFVLLFAFVVSIRIIDALLTHTVLSYLNVLILWCRTKSMSLVSLSIQGSAGLSLGILHTWSEGHSTQRHASLLWQLSPQGHQLVRKPSCLISLTPSSMSCRHPLSLSISPNLCSQFYELCKTRPQKLEKDWHPLPMYSVAAWFPSCSAS